MIVLWLLLLPVALVAYLIGSLDTMVIASNFVFGGNLRRLGEGNQWLSNFKRLFGIPGFIKLGLVEIVKDLLPILLGSLLLGIVEQPMVGKAFAGFCLVLGRLYPIFYRYRGSHAGICLAVVAFMVDSSAGIAALVLLGGVFWFSRYVSLAVVAEALIVMLVPVLVVDDALVKKLLIFTAALVLFKHIPALIRIIKHKEYRYSLEEDITYKLDEKF